MKKQTQKKRPEKGAKNTDRAAIILSLFREFPNNKFSLKHLASASGGATKEGAAKHSRSWDGCTTKASSRSAHARNTASRTSTCPTSKAWRT